jgi:glutaredoxin
LSVVVATGSVVRAGPPDSQGEAPTGGKASPGYVVVMADGEVVPSRSKPLSAFGSFRFVDVSGRTRVLPVSKVDPEATRVANADVPHDPTKGTLSVAGPVANEGPILLGGEEEEADEPKSRSVTVYSATWCGYCRQLKQYLDARKIPATIIEVDRLPPTQQSTARAKMKGMTGRVAYPTVVIGGEAVAGFSRSWIESRLGG